MIQDITNATNISAIKNKIVKDAFVYRVPLKSVLDFFFEIFCFYFDLTRHSITDIIPLFHPSPHSSQRPL